MDRGEIRRLEREFNTPWKKEFPILFYCYGQFLGVKRGHPDKDDPEKARKFARGLAAAEDIKAQLANSVPEAIGAAV